MYVKLFTSIYQGTLRGNSAGLLVFTNLLAHADRDGVVDLHPRAIAEEVGLPLDVVRDTLLVLESPDEESRSPEEQGRRIVRLDEHRAWGWRIVNYVKYRQIKSQEDRREQNREAQTRWREKQASAGVSKDKPSVITTKQPSAQSAHAGADADADADAEAKAEEEAAELLLSDGPAIKTIPARKQFGQPPAGGKPRAKKPSASAEAWEAYSAAYAQRYGVEPVRNAQVNAQMAQVVGKLGAVEAPAVAAFYVTSQYSFYVRCGHAVGALLKDAEKLRTEWATGRQGTSMQAMLADRTQTNFNAFAPLIAEAREREANEQRTTS